MIDADNVEACQHLGNAPRAFTPRNTRVWMKKKDERWKRAWVNRAIWLHANQSFGRILWWKAICPACNRSRRWCAAVLAMTCRDMPGTRAHWSGNDHYFRVFHNRERKITLGAEFELKSEIRSIIVRIFRYFDFQLFHIAINITFMSTFKQLNTFLSCKFSRNPPYVRLKREKEGKEKEKYSQMTRVYTWLRTDVLPFKYMKMDH